MANKELPIGNDSFSEVRESGYYVDKTAFVKLLIDKGKHNFLSRPRRFGKSLLVDTLQELFEGKKDLFEGLYIHDKWDWDVKYPVVRFNFGRNSFDQPGELQKSVRDQIARMERRECLPPESEVVSERFADLLERLAEKKGQRVVVLVDEYDKPILDALGTKELAEANRNTLRGFYSTIKSCNKYIRFSFLTGVSKFSKASLFSGLNNLRDITLKPEFSSICGYTENDLDTVFAMEIKEYDREKIKKWYNGYNWCGEENVYNPFSILLLLDNQKFKGWWFDTGTPSFLLETLDMHNTSLVELDGVVVGDDIMSSFDVGKIEPAALLFQSGYLTIAEEIPTERGSSYRLECPNFEVRMSLHGTLLQHLAPVSAAEHEKRLADLKNCVESVDFDGIEMLLQPLFEMIPYEWYTHGEIQRYEGHFASVICGAFHGAGLDVRPEDHASGGRVDMAIVTPAHVVLFEFKVLKGNTKPGDAMKQLRDRNYAVRYRGLGRPIYLVGVEFSPEGRNIAFFDFEEDQATGRAKRTRKKPARKKNTRKKGTRKKPARKKGTRKKPARKKNTRKKPGGRAKRTRKKNTRKKGTRKKQTRKKRSPRR